MFGIHLGLHITSVIGGDSTPGGSSDAYLMEDGSSAYLMEDGSSDLLMESA